MPGPPNARRARAPLPSIWYCPPLWIQTDEVATAEGGKSAPGQLHHLEQRDTVRLKKASQSYLTRVIQLPIYQSMTIRNWNTTTKLLAPLWMREPNTSDLLAATPFGPRARARRCRASSS